MSYSETLTGRIYGFQSGTNLSSATFASSRGLRKWYEAQRRVKSDTTHSWRMASTEVRTTGNVIAKFLREEQNARTVFNALRQHIYQNKLTYSQ